LPLVSGLGGNAGSQTAAVIVRGFALGEVELRSGSRALSKELVGSFVTALTDTMGFLFFLGFASLLL